MLESNCGGKSATTCQFVSRTRGETYISATMEAPGNLQWGIFALKRHVFDVGKLFEKISQSQRCGVLQDVTEKVFFSHQKNKRQLTCKIRVGFILPSHLSECVMVVECEWLVRDTSSGNNRGDKSEKT